VFGVEKSIAEALAICKALADYVLGKGQREDAYTVEKKLLRDGLKVMRCLLNAYFLAKRGGNKGKSIKNEPGQVLHRKHLKRRRYLSLFGELILWRYYYHANGSPGVFPLDVETNLPKRRYSYVVEELAQRAVNRMAYDEAVTLLEQLFGLETDKHTIENIAPEISGDADAFCEAEPAPAPETEEEILAVCLDGKGVPMVKDKPAEHKTRLSSGEKRSAKKEALVSVVYTIARFRRTAEDILKELDEHQTPPQRPKPHHKRAHATLRGKDHGMAWVVREIARRDPEHKKLRACVLDGSPSLRKFALKYLDGLGFTFILDLFHALEHLWEAAFVFHPQGSPEAHRFVRDRLRMLLKGKVGRLIGGLRQMLTKHKLSKNRQHTLAKVIAYYSNHREWMRYDQYIAAGLPIGSGSVEGACAHVVKDRMEGAGMRWRLEGAEAVLVLRALDLNGQWDRFWAYHMAQEATRRFRRVRASAFWPKRAVESA
jgi:hypothetical protein